MSIPITREEIAERLHFLRMPESEQAAYEDGLAACWKREISALETLEWLAIRTTIFYATPPLPHNMAAIERVRLFQEELRDWMFCGLDVGKE